MIFYGKRIVLPQHSTKMLRSHDSDVNFGVRQYSDRLADAKKKSQHNTTNSRGKDV